MKKFYSYAKGSPSDPPVLLLHGLLGSARNLTRLAEGIAASGFFVTAYDQRGHGRSPWADATEDYSLASLACDVFDVMDAAGIDQAHLVGHSMGARVSLAAASADPARVRSLTMLDSGIHIRSKHLDSLREIIEPLAPSYPDRATAERSLSSHSKGFRQFLLASLRSDPLPPHAQTWLFDLEGVRRELLGTIQAEQAEAFASVRCPILVARGENSDSLLPEDLDEMARLAPQARVATIERAAHWVHADNYQGTLDVVVRFLTEVK